MPLEFGVHVADADIPLRLADNRFHVGLEVRAVDLVLDHQALGVLHAQFAFGLRRFRVVRSLHELHDPVHDILFGHF